MGHVAEDHHGQVERARVVVGVAGGGQGERPCLAGAGVVAGVVVGPTRDVSQFGRRDLQPAAHPRGTGRGAKVADLGQVSNGARPAQRATARGRGAAKVTGDGFDGLDIGRPDPGTPHGVGPGAGQEVEALGIQSSGGRDGAHDHDEEVAAVHPIHPFVVVHAVTNQFGRDIESFDDACDHVPGQDLSPAVDDPGHGRLVHAHGHPKVELGQPGMGADEPEHGAEVGPGQGIAQPWDVPQSRRYRLDHAPSNSSTMPPPIRRVARVISQPHPGRRARSPVPRRGPVLDAFGAFRSRGPITGAGA